MAMLSGEIYRVCKQVGRAVAAKLQPNRTVKMDSEPKSETEDEWQQDDPMEGDTAEDAVLCEICGILSPSVSAGSQLYVL